jgi:hypothetical protein
MKGEEEGRDKKEEGEGKRRRKGWWGKESVEITNLTVGESVCRIYGHPLDLSFHFSVVLIFKKN